MRGCRVVLQYITRFIHREHVTHVFMWCAYWGYVNHPEVHLSHVTSCYFSNSTLSFNKSILAEHLGLLLTNNTACYWQFSSEQYFTKEKKEKLCMFVTHKRRRLEFVLWFMKLVCWKWGGRLGLECICWVPIRLMAAAFYLKELLLIWYMYVWSCKGLFYALRLASFQDSLPVTQKRRH